MPEPPKPPSQAPLPPPASPNQVTCPSCGWPNRPGSVRCEFCRTPFQRAAPAPPPPDIVCPHCGGVSPQLPGRRTCPDCGRGYAEAPSPLRKAQAMAIRGLRSIRLSGPALVYLILVVSGLSFFTFYYRAQKRTQTADHMRNVKKALEIHMMQSGGFPETLDQLGRGGPRPMDHELLDGWGNPLRYQVSGASWQSFDGPGRLYADCELRSAGSNGDFDDGDDVVWAGKSDEPPPPGMPDGGPGDFGPPGMR